MRKLKWIVQFSVNKNWIEDGFNLTRERAKEMIEQTLPYAYGYETNARILQAPKNKELAKIMGYKTIKAFKKDK